MDNIPAPCNERMSGIDSKIVGIFYNIILGRTQMNSTWKEQGALSGYLSNILSKREKSIRYKVASK